MIYDPIKKQDVSFLSKLNRAGCFNEHSAMVKPYVILIINKFKINRIFAQSSKPAVLCLEN